MKFSKRKKAKMRKQRQRRIKRYCSDMIGYHISDFEQVKDQAWINGTMYLLTEVEGKGYVIYKIVKFLEFVKLSAKRVLENKKNFSNPQYWQDKSKIQINDEGTIRSVEHRRYNGLVIVLDLE